MNFQTQADQALDHWRIVERELQSLRVNAPARGLMEQELVKTQASYNALIREARLAKAPELPPFPLYRGSWQPMPSPADRPKPGGLA